MSSTIKYKGATIATADNNTKTLQTSGKYLEGDIEVTDVSSSASIGTKIITANGQYDASDDGYDGYSEIDVNVPNTYSASDEGKVVSNGALVSQTSRTVTENGTYDTTLNDEVVVNVSGGGGGEFETGTYIGAGSGNQIREISVSKKWSHFLIVADNTYSQLTSDTTINLYMAYGDEFGYTFVPLKTGDGGYTTNQVQNRPASSYDGWRSQLTFTDSKIRWAFMGNGAIGTPINGATYRWFAW